VPRQNHDRTIAIRLTGSGLVVDYRLEVDPFTVVYQDLPAVLDRAELAQITSQSELYEAFTRCYAPILADNLVVTLDGKALSFQCSQRLVRLEDEDGRPLDHLRIDFRFFSAWPVNLAGEHRLEFQETNYVLQEGRILLSVEATDPMELISKTEPNKALQERAVQIQQPGDDAKLRSATAFFRLAGVRNELAAPSFQEPAPAETMESSPHDSLLGLLLDPQRGFWMLLLLAAGFGAVHALTPGHGKTLVAAYLVGERGTVWHALFLGLITTLTHTGAVLALAAGLFFFYPNTVPALVRTILGVGGGLLVAGMGLWLLLRRLGGGADHFHIGAGHHHHGNQPATVPAQRTEGGWWGLLVLGISGGMVPCWDAIAMFGFGVSAQRVGLALQMLLAFSAGLAAVLIVIGILVVRIKGFAGSRWGSGRLFQGLPLASALVVTLLGLWLCYDSLHQELPPTPAPSSQQAKG
jgi:ABC-type nickel/cobalt efflux system permease component RcnA